MKPTNDLALYVDSLTRPHWAVLYKYKEALAGEFLDFETAIDGVVVAVAEIRYNSKEDAFEQEAIVADKGYGPVMLYAVMDLVYPNFYMSTRTGRTTTPAKNLWKQLHSGKGSKLVIVEPTAHDYPNVAKDVELQHKYRLMRRGKPVDAHSMFKRHLKTGLKDYPTHNPLQERWFLLEEAADAKLRDKLGDIYGQYRRITRGIRRLLGGTGE